VLTGTHSYEPLGYLLYVSTFQFHPFPHAPAEPHARNVTNPHLQVWHIVFPPISCTGTGIPICEQPRFWHCIVGPNGGGNFGLAVPALGFLRFSSTAILKPRLKAA